MNIKPEYTQHSSIQKAALEVCLPVYTVATAVTVFGTVNRDIASGDGQKDAWLVYKHANVIHADDQISLG